MTVTKLSFVFMSHLLTKFCVGIEMSNTIDFNDLKHFSEQTNCNKRFQENHESLKIDLESLLTRPDLMLPYQNNNGQQVLFIESSGRDYLDGRQACAVESAARSGTKLNDALRIIVLLNSTQLDVHANNATSQLYKARNELNINFYSASNFDEILVNTPLDDKFLKRKIRHLSKTPIHHVSDALRLVAIYRLGGWYFDIDTVIFKSLDVYYGKNVLSTDQNSEAIKKMPKNAIIDPEHGIQSVGNSVANGVFHMAKNGSDLMWETMVLAKSDREMIWSSVGSTPLTSALRKICGIKPTDFAAQHVTVGGAYSPDRCKGYELVDPKYFFPVPWLQANQLFEANRSLAEWEEFFSDAYSVDFFRTSMGNKKK